MPEQKHRGRRQLGRITPEEAELIDAYRDAIRKHRDAIRQAAQPPQPKEDKNRPPKLFGYIRVSHQDSKDSGLGEEGQTRTVALWGNIVRADHPELGDTQWMKEDAPISAYSVPLRDRPKGSELDKILRRGDHVIFACLDRGFRDPVDCNTVVRVWRERGVTVHFGDLRVDTSTAMGECIMSVMATFARWYSARISEATKAALASLKGSGRLSNGHAPIGFKLEGLRGKKKILIPDLEARRIMGEIVRIRDKQTDWTWSEISVYVRQWIAEQAGRRRPDPLDRRWGVSRCQRAYYAELELRATEATTKRGLGSSQKE